jgi:hypothetical protein
LSSAISAGFQTRQKPSTTPMPSQKVTPAISVRLAIIFAPMPMVE